MAVLDPSDVPFGFAADRPTATDQPPSPDAPFNIVVLGDFSGRANRRLRQPLTPRRDLTPIPVDHDRLDQVMSTLGVALQLPIDGHKQESVELRFGTIEDFHPDQIYARVDLFQALEQTRDNLQNPSTFDQTAVQIDGRANGPGVQHDQETYPPHEDVPESSNRSAGSPLGVPGTLQRSAPPQRCLDHVHALLRQVINPHLEKAHSGQVQLGAAVNAAICMQMRSLIHQPDFQAMEATWRGLDFLACQLETDQQLRLYIVDMSKQELIDDLMATNDLACTDLYKRLFGTVVGGSSDDPPWAVVVGDYTFDATEPDAQALSRIATIAAHTRSPFIASASPNLLGCRSLTQTPDPTQWQDPIEPRAHQAWHTVRHLSQASWVGLVLPRFLLRQPYGANHEPTDQLEFEEIDGDPGQAPYLWGNGAIICAYLLGQAYSQQGWRFTPGVNLDIEDLPVHRYTQNDQSAMTPCGQAWLGTEAVQEILRRGFMPLVSIRNRDAVRLARIQSIAEPARNLAGRWG